MNYERFLILNIVFVYNYNLSICMSVNLNIRKSENPSIFPPFHHKNAQLVEQIYWQRGY